MTRSLLHWPDLAADSPIDKPGAVLILRLPSLWSLFEAVPGEPLPQCSYSSACFLGRVADCDHAAARGLDGTIGGTAAQCQ